MMSKEHIYLRWECVAYARTDFRTCGLGVTLTYDGLEPSLLHVCASDYFGAHTRQNQARSVE